MSFRDFASDLYDDFRVDNDFKDAVYTYSVSRNSTTGTIDWNAPQTPDTIYTTEAFKISLNTQGARARNALTPTATSANVIALVKQSEIPEPLEGESVTFEGKEWTVVAYGTDSINANYRIELKAK